VRPTPTISPPPNTGRPTGVDLDGDGRTYRARDAHGYGLFSGDGGMAILSRLPIGAVRDFGALPWIDLPEQRGGAVTRPRRFMLRLHTVAAWDVEVLHPPGLSTSWPATPRPRFSTGRRIATACATR
jgi:hypothetical protein